MTSLIGDSSVAIKWFITEPLSDRARLILEEWQMGTLTLHAPDLMVAEFGNIVWKKHRFQGLSAVGAQLIIETFGALNWTLTSSATLLAEACRLALLYNRSIYDSLYLALSLGEQCRFVTADERLVNAVGASIPNAIWLANSPSSSEHFSGT